MDPIRKAKTSGAAYVQQRVRPVVRRGIARVEPLERVAVRAMDQYRRRQRLRVMYDRLRHSYLPGLKAPDGLPSIADVDRVENAALKVNDTYATFFNMLCVDGDFERAAVTLTRRLHANKEAGRARSIGQVFQRYEELRPIADLCVALCAMGEPMPETARTLFTRTDLALVLRHASGEFFRFGFRWFPETAADALARALRGEVPLDADAFTGIDIAYASFAGGREDLSAGALEHAEKALAEVREPQRAARFRTRIETLRSWYGRAERAAQASASPAGEVPFAITGYQHPDWRFISRDLGSAAETLATLGHLVRRDDVTFTGDPELGAVANRLRAAVAPERRIRGAAAAVRLYPVDRDLSRYAQVPDGTWIVVSDWFVNPLLGRYWDVPLNPNLRPIFLSFSIDNVHALSAPGAVEYLQKYAPIGCLDWDTVSLLQAAGIPAFFSGPMKATLDLLVPPANRQEPSETTFVDVPPDGPGAAGTWQSDATRDRNLAQNLDVAEHTLRSYRDSGTRIVTSSLSCYLAARAVGCDVDFRPPDVGLGPVSDLKALSGAEFAMLGRRIEEKLGAVLGAILSGRSETEVYETWRRVCAADVAQAEAARDSVHGYPPLSFNLAEVCQVIRAGSVTIERSEPAPEGGSEINIEFSLDGNYKHQLDIVLDSVVANTNRPVRAFVLCRQHGPDDYARMARLFPTVSFMWLPTDNVNYGRIVGMNRWVTPATMDRTILPVLLPEIDRMLHFDLDAMALADVGELFDVDMEGKAIAAAAEPQPRYASGFETFRRSARRIRREGDPARARELVIRTHRHKFEFTIFNAGIMVLDLAKMREDDFCGRYLPYVQVFGLNGQVVLNAYVGGERVEVGAEWNRLMRLEMPDEVKIGHWAGPYKPWRWHQYVTGRELWRAGEERFAERVRRAERSELTAVD